MEALRNENIILSKEASIQLVNELIHPDREALKRRDEYLQSIDVMQKNQHEDYVEIEIPDLDLSFLDSNEAEMRIAIEDSMDGIKEKNSYEYFVLKINILENNDDLWFNKEVCTSENEMYIPVKKLQLENEMYQESLSIQAA